jgi:hypothetical protein
VCICGNLVRVYEFWGKDEVEVRGNRGCAATTVFKIARISKFPFHISRKANREREIVIRRQEERETN